MADPVLVKAERSNLLDSSERATDPVERRPKPIHPRCPAILDSRGAVIGFEGMEVPPGGRICGRPMSRLLCREGVKSATTRWWFCKACDVRGFGVFKPDPAPPRPTISTERPPLSRTGGRQKP